MSLAQIGEFAFVLLSRASNLHLVEVTYIISCFIWADALRYYQILLDSLGHLY